MYLFNVWVAMKSLTWQNLEPWSLDTYMCMYVAKMNVTKVFIVYYKLLNIRPYYVIKFQIPYKDSYPDLPLLQILSSDFTKDLVYKIM